MQLRINLSLMSCYHTTLELSAPKSPNILQNHDTVSSSFAANHVWLREGFSRTFAISRFALCCVGCSVRLVCLINNVNTGRCRNCVLFPTEGRCVRCIATSVGRSNVLLNFSPSHSSPLFCRLDASVRFSRHISLNRFVFRPTADVTNLTQ